VSTPDWSAWAKKKFRKRGTCEELKTGVQAVSISQKIKKG
jgi:hypothetical protein